MEKYKKLAWILGVLLSLGGIVALIFHFGGKIATDESKMFDSAEQKVEHVNYIKDAPTAAQVQVNRVLDSVNKAEAIKSRRLRDKKFIEQDSLRRITDSINRLNADQLYQIKQQLEQINNNN